MEVEFEDEQLRRLERDTRLDGAYSPGVAVKYRLRMQVIRNAPDERDFYALKSLHFERLKGDRDGCYSMRLNAQWRLILRLKRKEPDGKFVVVISILDYH
jgi:proteic killer suppression protein